MIRWMLDLLALRRRARLTGNQLRRLNAAELEDIAVSPRDAGRAPRAGIRLRSEIDTLL